MKEDLRLEGMTRPNLFGGHKEQSMRRGRKKEGPAGGDRGGSPALPC